MSEQEQGKNLLDVGARNHPIKDLLFAVRVGVVSWARLTPTMLASVTSREIRPNRVHMVEMCWKCAGINGLLVEAKFEWETEY